MMNGIYAIISMEMLCMLHHLLTASIKLHILLLAGHCNTITPPNLEFYYIDYPHDILLDFFLYMITLTMPYAGNVNWYLYMIFVMQSRGISRKSHMWHFQFSIWLMSSLGEVHFAENPAWIGTVVPRLRAIEKFSEQQKTI